MLKTRKIKSSASARSKFLLSIFVLAVITICALIGDLLLVKLATDTSAYVTKKELDSATEVMLNNINTLYKARLGENSKTLALQMIDDANSQNSHLSFWASADDHSIIAGQKNRNAYEYSRSEKTHFGFNLVVVCNKSCVRNMNYDKNINFIALHASAILLIALILLAFYIISFSRLSKK